ncbi:MAG: 50S ribosomal protein L24 [Candidatus Aminicenantes bacterium]|nr:50S ribosomal protein L24 [Candidatus Aminicenantes bacterium]
MHKIRIKKNDTVEVIAGKDKGRRGKVLKVIPETQKAVVEKVNFVKEFIRPDQGRNIQGGIMEKEAPIHVSNLRVVCPECDRGVRINIDNLQDGSKVRICSKCNATLEKTK